MFGFQVGRRIGEEDNTMGEGRGMINEFSYGLYIS
jgi:hypothetical protein